MKKRKKLLSLLLCGAMLFSLMPQTVFAEGAQDSGAVGLCEHHPEHDESCGYTEETPEVPCGHEHTEDCYTEVTACIHEHDEACGYTPAIEGTPCGYECEVCAGTDSGDFDNLGEQTHKISPILAHDDDYDAWIDVSSISEIEQSGVPAALPAYNKFSPSVSLFDMENKDFPYCVFIVYHNMTIINGGKYNLKISGGERIVIFGGDVVILEASTSSGFIHASNATITLGDSDDSPAIGSAKYDSATNMLSVTVSGDSSGITYQWYQENTAIPNATSASLVAPADGTYHCKLTMGNITVATDQVTVDNAPPVLSNGTAVRSSNKTATVKFTSSKAGQYYYQVVDSGEIAPTIDTSAAGTACSIGEQTISLTDLTASAKDIYIIVKDENGQASADAFKIEIPAFKKLYMNAIYSSGGVKTSGEITGGEPSGYGATCTITVTPNEGYRIVTAYFMDYPAGSTYSPNPSEHQYQSMELQQISGPDPSTGEIKIQFTATEYIALDDDPDYFGSIPIYIHAAKLPVKQQQQTVTGTATAPSEDGVTAAVPYESEIPLWNVSGSGYYKVDAVWDAYHLKFLENYTIKDEDGDTPKGTVSVVTKKYNGKDREFLTYSPTAEDAGKTITITLNPTMGFVTTGIDPIAFEIKVAKAPTYTISVTADPTAGGAVTGGGTYNKDASVTVTTTANACYEFVNWTENGVEVSANASYTFAAAADRNLIAVFAEKSHSWGDWTSSGNNTHTRTCSVCSKTETNSCSGGTATCQNKATCEICNSQYGELNTSNHATPVKTEAKAPICTETGNIEHWHCEACGKYFKDAALSQEIAKEQTTLAATGHTLTKTEEKAATCTEEGHEAYWTCETCGKLFSDENGTTEISAPVTIAKLAHNYGTEWKSDATSHWHECTVCAAKNEEAVHTLTWVVDKDATATEAGSKHEECSACGYKKAAVEIPATGTEHTHQFGTEWKADVSNHWHECACGEKSGTAAHTFGDWTTTKAATATEAGSRERSCTVCGYKVTETIPATGTGTGGGTTTTPSDPPKANPETGVGSSSPQTGDNSNLALWFALLALSGAGLTGTVIYSRKKKYSE